MLFNSREFALFFALFFYLYWFVFKRNLKFQNLLLLIGSYLFYAWWDWRFLSLLIISSIINYSLGIYLGKTVDEKRRKFFIFVGLLQGLGGLLFFKYFNFFIVSFKDAFAIFDINLNIHTLNIILPLGISFYTLRTISYLLDINSEKIKPTSDWVVFFSYVSFFPSLLSGPIDRAKTLIPQLEKNRVFEYDRAIDGFRQIVWGIFKKVVIADNLTNITNPIFDNYQTLPASSLMLASALYVIQVYADFSGYSDMAIGFSRLLGFNITKNFNFPFFAQNIAEYWQRWHISLTTWMTDYVFTPLSFIFRGLGKFGLFLAILINFILVGLWHGANWTYLLFGLLNGIYFIPLILKGTLNRKKIITNIKIFPSFRELINMFLTFTLVVLTAILFRSDSIIQAFNYYTSLFSFSFFSIPSISIKSVLIPCIFIIIEWFQREKEHGLQIDNIKSQTIRWSIYFLLLLIFVFKYETTTSGQFVYFKF